MAKSELQIADLRKRLSSLLADWGTEISAVIGALESEHALIANHAQNVRALQDQSHEVAALRQRVRDRDLALNHIKKISKEKDMRLAELDKRLKHANERVAELERMLDSPDSPARYPEGVQQAEFEAMRAELDARKSLIKSLRTDAARNKTLEKKLAQDREAIASMKASIERHARKIAELRRSSDSWEQKYLRLSEEKIDMPSRNREEASDRDRPVDAASPAPSPDETMEVDGAHTIVIDMTEPLRKAQEERRRERKRG